MLHPHSKMVDVFNGNLCLATRLELHIGQNSSGGMKNPILRFNTRAKKVQKDSFHTLVNVQAIAANVISKNTIRCCKGGETLLPLSFTLPLPVQPDRR